MLVPMALVGDVAVGVVEVVDMVAVLHGLVPAPVAVLVGVVVVGVVRQLALVPVPVVPAVHVPVVENPSVRFSDISDRLPCLRKMVPVVLDDVLPVTMIGPRVHAGAGCASVAADTEFDVAVCVAAFATTRNQ